ncbi:MAG: lipoate--protein ligase family protein [Candidatus Ranarchaeia archaeon]
METWRFIPVDYTPKSASWHVAADEVLARNKSLRGTGLIRWWTNTPSVIVGNGQRVADEVNVSYAKKHRITIVRRWTGGGAVYNDQGVLNVTCIWPHSLSEKKLSLHRWFRDLGEHIVYIITKLGVPVKFVPPNRIQLLSSPDKEFKIGGGAGRILKDRILIHYSILLNVNLNHLRSVLIAHQSLLGQSSQKIEPVSSMSSKRAVRKYVPSYPMHVQNLSDYLTDVDEIDKKIQNLSIDYLRAEGIEPVVLPLTKQEANLTKRLVASKYNTDSWTFRF